jgi:predicted metal-dependent hydrolase
MAGGLLNQDSTFYARGKTLAKDEFSELVEIYREENGNEKLTKRQLKEIRELVVAKVEKYVESFRNQTTASAAYQLKEQTEKLRNTSNEYRDPESGVIYPVISPAEAAEVEAINPDAEFKEITPNRLIQTR